MPVSHDESPLVASLLCLQLSTVGQADASLSPGRESYHTVTYQIIAGAFICFNHLTDQAFIWDQAAIWDRRLIPSSQKSEMKMSQTSPASRLILWHPSGQYLSSASEVVAAEETIQPTSTHSKLLISAVTHGGGHLFLHRPDHFAGHSLVACPFADHPSPHVYLKLLASLLPPSTRQPSYLLLSSLDRR